MMNMLIIISKFILVYVKLKGSK